MTSPKSHLLEAPRDIRFLIYKARVAPDDGLFYHYETGRLRKSDGEPVSLALMRTCKLIAFEMNGFALSENTITFRTHYSASLSIALDKYETQRFFLGLTKHAMLSGVVSSIMATNAVEGVSRRFPFSRPTFEKFMATGGSWARDDILANFPAPSPSPKEKAIHYALQLASAAGQTFRDEALVALREFTLNTRRELRLERREPVYNFPDSEGILNLEAHSWIIPDEEFSARIDALLFEVHGRRTWEGLRGNGRRLSAVATCIRFLNALTSRNRADLRRLHLIEDFNSGQDIHRGEHGDAIGLIPFCIENTQLHVTRRVDFWNNIYIYKPMDYAISYNICLWIIETAALPALGMPVGSFSLIIDAKDAPDQATEVFQDYVHRDIAWEQAIVLWEKDHPGRNVSQSTSTLKAECLPQTVADIVAGRSFIRCTFDPGQPWKVSDVFDTIKDIDRYGAVYVAYKTRQPHDYRTRRPLPSRLEIWNRRPGVFQLKDSWHWEQERPVSEPDEDSFDVSSNDSYSTDSQPTEEEILASIANRIRLFGPEAANTYRISPEFPI